MLQKAYDNLISTYKILGKTHNDGGVKFKSSENPVQ